MLPACNIKSISSNLSSGSGGSGGATASSGSDVGGASATTAAAGTGGASSSSGSVAASSSSGAVEGVACAPEAARVYAISADKKLYQLGFVAGSPWTTTLIGALTCATAADPYSIAIDRSGQAWVGYADGNLFKVDTTTAACTATAFVPGQHGFTSFSLAFAANTPGGDTETLHASGSGESGSATGLATIDRSTLTLTPVGNYDIPPMITPVTPPVGLAGRSDATLFGGFLRANRYYMGQFDPTSAHVLETDSTPGILLHDLPATTRYAVIPWGSYFAIFVTTAGGMQHYFYDNIAAISGGGSVVTAFSFFTIGASTCATANPPF